MTELEKIKQFLNNKPGYKKEGLNRFKKVLIKKGFKINNISDIDLRYLLNPNIKSLISPKRLFFDIETSYNIVRSWRIGYNININHDDIIHERAIICAAWKWEGEDKVHYISWNNGCDKNVVSKLIEVLGQATEVVGHNIERYDTSFILTRAIKHGILALPKYTQTDTLKMAKYKFNFNSNKLDYIANFLGLGTKYKHSGMSMWNKIIDYDLFKTGTKNDRDLALNEMIHYNIIDVTLTEEVYHRLKLYTNPNTHHGVLNDRPKFTCPHDGSTNVQLVKTIVTASGSIKRLMKCNDCGQQFIISNRTYIKYLKN